MLRCVHAPVPARGAGATACPKCEKHIAAGARLRPGTEHAGLFDAVVHDRAQRHRAGRRAAAAPAAAGRGGRGRVARPPPPARETWHAEPVKVFDNLYFVGQTEYSAWAITTSQGIILLDAIYDYSVEDEVVGGLKKLGLDPADIKYVIVSHGHLDHAGGAKFLQETVRRAADHVGGRLRPARSAEPAVEAEARHGGDRRHDS